MKRVIFVGMNNKPGLTPLCPSTKSGKLIDRIIAELPEYECVKTNLWDLDNFPSNKINVFNKEWITRSQWQPGNIIVPLGECVRKAFIRSGLKYIAIGHPSAIWANNKKDDYILNAVIKIIKY